MDKLSRREKEKISLSIAKGKPRVFWTNISPRVSIPNLNRKVSEASRRGSSIAKHPRHRNPHQPQGGQQHGCQCRRGLHLQASTWSVESAAAVPKRPATSKEPASVSSNSSFPRGQQPPRSQQQHQEPRAERVPRGVSAVADQVIRYSVSFF